MANFIYGKAKQAMLNGEINFASNQYRLLLVKTSLYEINQNVDEFVSDIPLESITARSSNISGITNVLGIIDGNDVIIEPYNGGVFEALIFYQVGSTDNNSRLIFYIDNSEGLPYTVTASNVTVTIIWSNSVNKILSL